MKKLIVLFLILSGSLNSYSAGLVDGQRISKKSCFNSKVVKKEARKISKFQANCDEQERNFFEVLSVSLKNISVKFFYILIGDFLNFSHNDSKIQFSQPSLKAIYFV